MVVVVSHGLQLWVIPDREAAEREGVQRTQAMWVHTDGVLVRLTTPFSPARA